MKIIEHYQVDITLSADFTQEDLDILDKVFTIDGLKKLLELKMKRKIESVLTADSIVPKVKVFMLEK